MKLVCWNINGIRAAYKKGLDKQIKKFDADVLCFQETKALEEQLEDSQAHPPGYIGYYSSAVKKGYSGVATLVREDFKATKIRKGIEEPRFDDEGRFVVTRIAGIDIYNIYFPSGTTGDVRQDFKYEFLDSVLDHLNSLPTARKDKLIICGDFNICHREIDIHHPKEATKKQFSGFLPDERKWMDSLMESGFVDAFRHVHGDKPSVYTWWSFRANSRAKNLGWRIDYFVTSKKLAKKIKAAEIMMDVPGSDHCPISLELDL